jgi:hypothetical protein
MSLKTLMQSVVARQQITPLHRFGLRHHTAVVGTRVVLVNAKHVKNVPGRKSGVLDCEWLRELHSVGLLRGSFRPVDGIVALRADLRHRGTRVQTAGMQNQRMQKAHVQMNLQLPLVVSDITGVTALPILPDIVAGRRDLARARPAPGWSRPVMAADCGQFLLRPQLSSREDQICKAQ